MTRGATGAGRVTGLLLVFVVTGPVAGQERAGRAEPTRVRVVALGEALDQAVERNRELTTARLELRSANQRVREAWSSVFPTLDLDASYTRNVSVPANFLPRIIFDPDADPNELVAVKFGADNAWSFQLRAEQTLFQASVFVGVSAAGRYQSLQREMVRGQTIDVATRVKLAYYDALLARQAVRLSDNSVQRVRQTLDETRKMHEAGLSSSYDVLRLEVELANLEPQLRRARNSVLAARRALAVELGAEDLESVDVAGSLFDFAPAEATVTDGVPATLAATREQPGTRVPDIERAMDLAIENRSDLRQLRLTEDLRRTELRVEQSEYLPRVSLFGTYSINAQQNGSPRFFGASDAQRSYGRQVGVQVSMPLFAGFRRPARTAQIRSDIESTRTRVALTTDLARAEIRTLFEQMSEANDRVRAQRLALRQAERGYDIARAQYREGIGSQLELTDAEVALRQSEFNYAEAVYDFVTAEARLGQAVGVVPELQQGVAAAVASESRNP
ncbi:MAG: TolC family protein [Gemmatimonadetes bacterium]|nr:TolC family protein [Gemmatimonadota bacterium]